MCRNVRQWVRRDASPIAYFEGPPDWEHLARLKFSDHSAAGFHLSSELNGTKGFHQWERSSRGFSFITSGRQVGINTGIQVVRAFPVLEPMTIFEHYRKLGHLTISVNPAGRKSTRTGYRLPEAAVDRTFLGNVPKAFANRGHLYQTAWNRDPDHRGILHRPA